MADRIRLVERELHVYEGVSRAMDDPLLVLELVGHAPDIDGARAALESAFQFDSIQANAVLDMQLRRVPREERNKIHERRRELVEHLDLLHDMAAGGTTAARAETKDRPPEL